jgi:putative lipoprotein
MAPARTTDSARDWTLLRACCATTRTVIAAALALALCPVDRVRADDWLGPDKALHFGVSAGLSAGAYAASALAFEDRAPRLAIGVGFGVVAGAGKELYDAAGHGDPSWRDFSWDVLGAVTGAAIAWLIDELVSGSEDAPAGSATRERAQRALRFEDGDQCAGR